VEVIDGIKQREDSLFFSSADIRNFRVRVPARQGHVVPPNFLVLYFWVQNGRKTGPPRAQNGVWLVSKGSRMAMGIEPTAEACEARNPNKFIGLSFIGLSFDCCRHLC
jgi:hypothetical protein